MEINWTAFKPEQQAEYVRELEDLIKTGYHTMSAEQKKSGMSNGVVVDVMASYRRAYSCMMRRHTCHTRRSTRSYSLPRQHRVDCAR